MKSSASQAGTLVAAFLASLCCLGPIVLGVLGVSSLGLAAAIGPFRPWLLGLTAAFLATAFYFAYRPQPMARCGPDGSCPTPPSRRGQRISLWIVTVLTLLTATYPRWASSVGLGTRAEARAVSVAPGRANKVVMLDVQGMTCADCEQHIVEELRRVPGVIDAHVSYATENAVLEAGNAVDLLAVSAAVERAGYRASNIQLAARPTPQTALAEPSHASGAERQTSKGPSGRWVGQLTVGDGRTSEVVIDLDRTANRWVGEFDLHDFEVEDYPVLVEIAAHDVRLNLTAAKIDFVGKLSAAGDVVRGTANSQGHRDSLILRQTGAPVFSAGFLELEQAAEDSTRVTSLGSDGAELRKQFNADRNHARLLMLLSPT